MLFALRKNSPDFWQSETTIDECIQNFLFGGKTSLDEYVFALRPLNLKAHGDNIKFQYYVLDLIGFNQEETEKIIKTWEGVYDLVNTLRRSILPNMLTLLFLEQEAPGLSTNASRV